MDISFVPYGYEPYDSLKVVFTTEESNLLRFVCAVDGVSFEKKFTDLMGTILSMAKLSLSLTGMSLKDSVRDWNSSKVCQDHPERIVTLLPEA